jgi:hypothetical protein
VLLLTAACRDSAYSAASKADTPAAWRAYLAGHPDDESASQGKARLAELELAEAQKVHTVLAYKRFLDEFGDTDSAPRAKALLEGLRFNAAKEAGTARAMRLFVREHPDGAHRAEAEQLLSTLELKEVSSLTDSAELERFVAQHPDDPKATEATAKLDDAAFQKSASAAALYAYLRDYPAGTHREDAKRRLLSLQLDGLLFSGLVDEAEALAKRSPLAAGLGDLPKRLERGKAERAVETSADERIKKALIGYHLRSIDDLVHALSAPDPMDRWEAARELGFVVSVKAIDPLLEALSGSRTPAVRLEAFQSLGRLLRTLPRSVADYEVATRLEALREKSSDAEVHLTAAALLDLTGQLERASAEYQKVWDPSLPDPVVLKRWVEIRTERRQPFSAAVAARQLALWAKAEVDRRGPATPESALGLARDACTCVELTHFAREVVAQAKKAKTDFPEDVDAFGVRVEDAARLAEARLKDAELLLVQADARARRCADRAFGERLALAEKARLDAVEALRTRPPKDAPLALEVIRDHDPESSVREAAARVLASLNVR